MTETNERDWVKDVGEPAYASIVEMVAAIGCDYDRLEDLRDALSEAFDDEAKQNDPTDTTGFKAWVKNMTDSPDGTLQEAAAELLALGGGRWRVQGRRRCPRTHPRGCLERRGAGRLAFPGRQRRWPD